MDGDRRRTYAELDQSCRRIGEALHRIGARAGDRVCFLGDNSIEFLECYFAVPSAGLIFIPLNTRLAADEIAYILRDSGCKAAIVGPGYEDLMDAAVSRVENPPELIGIAEGSPAQRGWHDYGILRAELEPLSVPPVTPMQTAYLYYTSGTTGRPKGVMLSHQNVLLASLSCCAAVGVGRGDCWLHAGPMFHLGDAWATWGVALLGGRQVMMRYHSERTLQIMIDERVSHTLLVPSAVQTLIDIAEAQGQRLGGLRALLYGGAPMPESIYRRVRAAIDAPLVQLYGTTETAGTCTVLYDDEHVEPSTGRSRVSAAGREIPLVSINILGSDGQVLPPGQLGEIAVSGPTVMQGYWQRPDDPRACMHGSQYRTGDIGLRDDEGYIWITGRSKDMIISGGENVYALEVERVLAEHVSISEVAVIGIPDRRWGEVVCAVVVPRPGMTLTLESVQEHARRHLGGFKIPRALRIIEALPKNGAGKVSKAAIRAHESDGQRLAGK